MASYLVQCPGLLSISIARATGSMLWLTLQPMEAGTAVGGKIQAQADFRLVKPKDGKPSMLTAQGRFLFLDNSVRRFDGEFNCATGAGVFETPDVDDAAAALRC